MRFPLTKYHLALPEQEAQALLIVLLVALVLFLTSRGSFTEETAVTFANDSPSLSVLALVIRNLGRL